MSDLIPAVNRPVALTAEREDPESYVRINIEKNTKGYNVETTVSLTWRGGPELGHHDLKTLLHMADDLARDEVDRRKYEDQIAAAEAAQGVTR